MDWQTWATLGVIFVASVFITEGFRQQGAAWKRYTTNDFRLFILLWIAAGVLCVASAATIGYFAGTTGWYAGSAVAGWAASPILFPVLLAAVKRKIKEKTS